MMNQTDLNNMLRKVKYGDIAVRNELIESNKGFIRRMASYVCKRNLDWSNDDELSIALMAFNDALSSFDPDKGAQFESFCGMLIKNRLIDYFRSKNNPCISLDAIADEELSVIENKEALDRYSISHAAEERSIEIHMFNKELSHYNLSIADLTVNSPKHRDTRKTLFKTAVTCSENKDIIKFLKKNKMLPIKEICQITGVKRKFIEQWRRYLIALFVIVSSDEYLYLKEYINFDDNEEVAK